MLHMELKVQDLQDELYRVEQSYFFWDTNGLRGIYPVAPTNRIAL